MTAKWLAGSRWGAPIARQVSADRARGWHNRVTLGARIQHELGQDRRKQAREAAMVAATEPTGEFCHWPRIGRG